MRRIIMHLDLDCFYCQVEQKRLSLDASEPLAVQQWSSLVAVNYSARVFGVSRHDTIEEAVKKCPSLKLVHVQTYEIATNIRAYHPDPSQKTHKSCLDEYRNASVSIFTLLKRECSVVGAIFEKGSIDEAFVDISQMTTRENPLKAAVDFANLLRKLLKDELGFTCSVGIAPNKMLAKLCSSRNKPDKLTCLNDDQIEAFLKDIPLQSVRMFGGKLGKILNELRPPSLDESKKVALGDLWKIDKSLIIEHLQRKGYAFDAISITNRIYGIDDELVQERSKPRSILSAKSLRTPLVNEQELMPILNVVIDELWQRISQNRAVNFQVPATCSVILNTKGKNQTFSVPFSLHQSHEEFFETVRLRILKAAPFPLRYLSISVARFRDATKSIDKFATEVPKDLEFFVRCDRCSTYIQNDFESVQEHQDWHFAKDLP